MGKMLVTLIGVRVAGTPTFIPGAEVSKHHTMLTVINNRGKNKAGVEQSDEITLDFWGKYAQTAALYLDKGREINVIGELRSHTVDTGQTKANGKRDLNRNNSIVVDRFYFGADSKKELVARINANLAAAKAAGKLDPNATITGDDLIAVSRGAAYDFNPTLAAQTGMYGCAKVFVKGTGFLTPGQPVNIPAGVPAGPTPQDAEIAALKAQAADAEIARLKEQIAKMNTSATAPVEAVIPEVVDAFAK